RESGSIEQDADVVMFVFRESYYLKNKEPRPATVEHAEWQAKMNGNGWLGECAGILAPSLASGRPPPHQPWEPSDSLALARLSMEHWESDAAFSWT
ncbi:MAG: DnaB-like helicase C-terminal domain-containing protein, partial [Promethearchaeia archaeon]